MACSGLFFISGNLEILAKHRVTAEAPPEWCRSPLRGPLTGGSPILHVSFKK